MYGDNWKHLIFREYDDFLEDLEEDKMYRQNVNIYKGIEPKFISNHAIKRI